MKRLLKALLASLFILGALTACQVEKTEDGELPDVKVEVEGEAELPEYDIDGPEVDVTSEEKTVKVPDVDVKTKDATVEVPQVDIKMPTEEGYGDDESATDSDDGEGGNR